METTSARMCDVKFEICLLQVSCKKHFQFAVLWPLLPSTSCVAIFLGTQPSRRQENVKL